MSAPLASALQTIAAQAGRGVHALWIALIGVSALSQTVISAPIIAGLAAAALPGVLGLVLAGRALEQRRAARFTLALAWVAPGIAASLAFASTISPAALVFLAGPAALAAAGGRNAARFSAVISALAFILCAAAGFLGPLGTGAPAALSSPQLWAGLAGFFAVCGLIARARLTHRLDAALRALDQARPAAEGFARAPKPLLALDRDGLITAASRSVRRLAPGAPRNLSGLPLDGLAFDEAQASAVRSGLASARAGGGVDGGCFKFTVRAADGAQARVEARAVATPAGFVLGLDAPAEPAAPAGQSDAELDALKAERDAALAANRSKSEFLAAVSHELRTPLNAIIGFSDVMKQRLFGPLPARYAEYGDLIHESGAHLLELIGDVLDMSKIEADRYELTPEPFDARDVVEICTKMLRLKAQEAGLALYCETGDAPLQVQADRKAMRQILLNLLSNAVKFTPDGGAVVVMARAQGPDLVLAVGDSGVGIAADELDSIGKPYSQSNSGRTTSERGTGLGLSLVRSLAEMHGGTMSVQSAPNAGTTVTVRLPVMEDAQLNAGPGEAEPLEVHARIRAAQEAGHALSDIDARTA
jgi:cell cycle sensor histidine kinase DivJ